MPKKRKKKQKEETCEPCRISASLGMALKVCDILDGKDKCDKLADKIWDDKITPRQVIRILKRHATKKKDTKSLKKLRTIEKFMKKNE